MILYHGTTRERAKRICREGFEPRRPSKRVWFATSKQYARNRAKVQARRSRDQAVVLTCEVDIPKLRWRYGDSRMIRRDGNLAVSGRVSVDVIRSLPSVPGEPSAPDELASWINDALGVKHYKGVKGRHPGVMRLARWIVNRVAARRGRYPRLRELFEMARRFLPEQFKDRVFDEKRARAIRVPSMGEIEVKVDTPPPDPDDGADEILDRLLDPNPKRRVRGLAILGKAEEPDLFDWCYMMLSDPNLNVRLAALDGMLKCEYIVPDPVIPLADSPDKLIRAAAIAVLAKHGEDEAAYWVETGLKDPAAHVRAVAARYLAGLDPGKEKSIFEIALYDPNSAIAERARRLTVGKGYHPKF